MISSHQMPFSLAVPGTILQPVPRTLVSSCLRSLVATPPTTAMMDADYVSIARAADVCRSICPTGVAFGAMHDCWLELVLPRFVPPGAISHLPNAGAGVVSRWYAPSEHGAGFGVFLGDLYNRHHTTILQHYVEMRMTCKPLKRDLVQHSLLRLSAVFEQAVGRASSGLILRATNVTSGWRRTWTCHSIRDSLSSVGPCVLKLV